MKTKKSVVSIFTTTWGHKSIAEAVKNALGEKYKIYFNYIEPNPISVKPYNIAYVLFPTLTKIPFKISEIDSVSRIVEKYLTRPYAKKIEDYIAKQKPLFVVNTYFAFNFVMEKLSKKYSYTLINIIADPRSFHKLSVLPNSYNFVFDSESEKRSLKFGSPAKMTIRSGWFVRKQFMENYSKSKVRKHLGLSPDCLTLCIIGGSEGTANILKILPALVDSKKTVQVVFICGKNKGLYQTLRVYQKIQNFTNGNSVKMIIKGYTENTHKYLQASDIVIGKAGPNLLFETVATHTPFFAISHIAGQEDGNLEIIKQYKVGFVEENPMKAIKLVRKIIKNPDMLDWFQKPLEKLAEYNRKSSAVLSDFVGNQLQKNKPQTPS